MTPQINETLNGDRSAINLSTTVADEVIGRYLAGYLVTISKQAARKVDFKLMSGVPDVWAIAFRKPKPGWRLLGRFVEKNVFVGLRLVDRQLGNYSGETAKIPSDWGSLLTPLPFISSPALADHIGPVVRNVDEPQP